MTNYSLSALQDRRSDALERGDTVAYWALDILIGHFLGTADMYAKHNVALQRMREHAETVAS